MYDVTSCRGGLCPVGLCLWDLFPGVSVRGVSVQGDPPPGMVKRGRYGTHPTGMHSCNIIVLDIFDNNTQQNLMDLCLTALNGMSF